MAYRPQSVRSWVAGVTRGTDKRLCLQLQQLDGRMAHGTFANIAPRLAVGKGIKRSIELDLREFEPASTSEYLKAIGYPELISSGQATYRVETKLGYVWIPAQLLVTALFGTNAFTRSYLLVPLGLHMGMRSFEHGQGLTYTPVPVNVKLVVACES